MSHADTSLVESMNINLSNIKIRKYTSDGSCTESESSKQDVYTPKLGKERELKHDSITSDSSINERQKAKPLILQKRTTRKSSFMTFNSKLLDEETVHKNTPNIRIHGTESSRGTDESKENIIFDDLEEESDCLNETFAGDSYMQRPSEFVSAYSFLEKRSVSMTMPHSLEEDFGVMKGLNTSMIPRTLENSIENFSFVTFDATLLQPAKNLKINMFFGVGTLKIKTESADF